jgi:serine/threonine-protein kinase
MRKDTDASVDGDTLPLGAVQRRLGELATLAATLSVPSPVTLETGAHVARAIRFEERYEHRALLGEGGMGAVDLFQDRAIGREVAIKRIRPEASSPGALARFVREARVQGQLEHPAIVPVHDLAENSEGTAFFTMKRVRGASLDDILDALATDAPDARARYGRRKLLTAFATVCLAVDFAHSRGVLHRDLKPANVMLGDFGEVYVLD